ncbi:integrase catalytic domain-containing protein [Trichonephila clavipes]|nr:integrase catalytic domain-containing protein [Trichonephila clavipes]
MYTVRCDCESLINSRTLNYVRDDVEDLEHLTPAMFLQDIREIGVPELDQIDENKLNKRLVYRNRMQNDLRKRFRVEYLDANEGSHLPINIDHELSKPQRVATSSMQPCSSISNGGAGLEPRAEASGHQQAEPSSMQTCSSVSNVEPRLETLELPDILTSDSELQQPVPRRSRYGRLLKPRKKLNDYC